MIKKKNSAHKTVYDKSLVTHIAKLANLPLSDSQQITALTQAFDETMLVVDKLREVETSQVEPSHQVTGLENIWREDTVDTQRMFTQKQALANAHETYDGYFVVPQIIESE